MSYNNYPFNIKNTKHQDISFEILQEHSRYYSNFFFIKTPTRP